MDKNKFIKDNFGISDKTLKLVSEAEESIKEQFKHIENICEINQLRVMKAFLGSLFAIVFFVIVLTQIIMCKYTHFTSL